MQDPRVTFSALVDLIKDDPLGKIELLAAGTGIPLSIKGPFLQVQNSQIVRNTYYKGLEWMYVMGSKQYL